MNDYQFMESQCLSCPTFPYFNILTEGEGPVEKLRSKVLGVREGRIETSRFNPEPEGYQLLL